MSMDMVETVRDFFNEYGKKPLSVHELEAALDIRDAVDFKELVKALNYLKESGELIRTRKDRFGVPEKINLVRVRILMYAKGFSFLIPYDEDKDDIYIHHSDLALAMNNDKVLVCPERNEGRGNNP